jgi:hypothetical protein
MPAPDTANNSNIIVAISTPLRAIFFLASSLEFEVSDTNIGVTPIASIVTNNEKKITGNELIF